MTKVIGLTGGIATGKSTVSNLFRQAGFPIIDADQVAHQLQQPGKTALERLTTYFGPQIVQADGQLNRRKLGEKVFQDPRDRQRLNQIMQPLIRETIADQIANFKKQGLPYVILDIPLLFEAHYAQDCDLVIVVTTTAKTQLQRLMVRNNYSKEEAMRRIDAQMPLQEKIVQADVVIDNNGSQDSTRQQVANFINNLKTGKLW